MKKTTKDDYIKKVKDLYGNMFEVIEFNGLQVKAKIKHNKCGNTFEIIGNELTRERRQENFKKDLCPLCTSKVMVSKEEAYKKLEELTDGKLVHIEEYINTRVKTKFKCTVCGNITETSFHAIFNNMKRKKSNNTWGCSNCSNKSKKDIILFEEQLLEKRKNAYILTENSKYTGNENKIEIKHVKCGKNFYTRANDILYGRSSCPYCYNIFNGKSSKTEVYLEYLFKKFKIKYDKEYNFNNKLCNKETKKILYIDFYLPEYNLVIEFDGIFHFNITTFNNINSLKINHKRDKIKMNYCKKNNISILRLHYGLTKEEIYKIINLLSKEALTYNIIKKYDLYFYDSEKKKTINEKTYFEKNRDKKQINLVLDEEEKYM